MNKLDKKENEVFWVGILYNLSVALASSIGCIFTFIAIMEVTSNRKFAVISAIISGIILILPHLFENVKNSKVKDSIDDNDGLYMKAAIILPISTLINIILISIVL